jgi:hypothetical protein
VEVEQHVVPSSRDWGVDETRSHTHPAVEDWGVHDSIPVFPVASSFAAFVVGDVCCIWGCGDVLWVEVDVEFWGDAECRFYALPEEL